jgi:hypothetical protein
MIKRRQVIACKKVTAKLAFGNAVERSVRDYWKTGGLVSKLEKAGQLFVTQMERRHRRSSI